MRRALCRIGIALTWAAPAAAREPPRILLRPAQPSMVLGVDEDMLVAIEVEREPLSPGSSADWSAADVPLEESSTPRMFANVGSLDTPERVGPREFTARYQPPPERFPQIAVIAAEVGGRRGRPPLRGVSTIRLRGATSVAFRTDAGARVTMRVGEKEFGPVEADREGRVRIPVVVPPGVGIGVARSTDRHGLTTETKVDLQLPDFNRVLITAPEILEAGGFAEAVVYAVDPAGSPSPTASMSLRSSGPPAQALGGSPGAARFLVEAPENLAYGPLKLLAIVAGAPEARAQIDLPVRPALPRHLKLDPSGKHLVVGSGAKIRVNISATDPFGNPTPASSVRVTLDGEPVEAEKLFDGRLAIDLPAPAAYAGRDRIVIVAELGLARAVGEIRVSGGPPAKIRVEVAPRKIVADGRSSAEVRVHLEDLHGTPTSGPDLDIRTDGGRLGAIIQPAEGLYVARFIPALALQRGEASIEAALSEELRAAATVEVEAPFHRVALTPRAGVFSNLGQLAGPALFVDATVHPPFVKQPLRAGLSLGYLRDRLDVAGESGITRLAIDQFPALLVARWHFRVTSATEAAAGAGAGASLAWTTLETFGGSVRAIDLAAAVQLSAELGIAWGPGQIIGGVRYLWIDLGKVSDADTVRGNTAGLVADLGYRFGW